MRARPRPHSLPVPLSRGNSRADVAEAETATDERTPDFSTNPVRDGRWISSVAVSGCAGLDDAETLGGGGHLAQRGEVPPNVSASRKSPIRAAVVSLTVSFAPVRGCSACPRPADGDRGRRHAITPVYGQAKNWKACWGQPLASSNLASSANASPGKTPGRYPLGTGPFCLSSLSFSLSRRPNGPLTGPHRAALLAPRAVRRSGPRRRSGSRPRCADTGAPSRRWTTP